MNYSINCYFCQTLLKSKNKYYAHCYCKYNGWFPILIKYEFDIKGNQYSLSWYDKIYCMTYFYTYQQLSISSDHHLIYTKENFILPSPPQLIKLVNQIITNQAFL